MQSHIIDDPYQASVKDTKNQSITNIELEHITFKNENEEAHQERVHKPKNSKHSKMLSKTNYSFGNRAESFSINRRISTMMRDYDYKPESRKRTSADTRKIVTIYEQNEGVKNITDILKNNMRRKINKHFASK